MNGRVYDPTLGRFLSADPIIQAPHDLQSYNRYSYVRNNPLRYTDPSGYSWWSKNVTDKFRSFRKNVSKAWRENWRSVVSIGMMFVMPGAFAAMGANTFWAGALTGAASGAVTGGSRGAWTGLLTGGLLHGAGKIGMGSKFGLLSKTGLQKVTAHGLIGGINSKLMGGKFAHGFASMGFTQGANIQFGNTGMLGSAVIGGVASELAGGSFKYGAIQSAMSYGLNDCLHGEHCTFVPPSLPQGVVDFFSGFGDGVYSAITLGMGDLGDIREMLGTDALVNKESAIYGGAEIGGNVVGAAALGGAVASRSGWGLAYDGPHKGMGPHLHYGPKYPNSSHPKYHFGPRNPNFGKENFTWRGWRENGRPWRWR